MSREGVIVISLVNYKSTIENQIDEFEALKSEYPENLSAYMALAEYNFITGNYLSAICAYQNILKQDTDITSARLNLALLYMVYKFYNEGFSEFLSLLKQEPNNIFYYLFYKYYSGKYEIPAEQAKDFSEITERNYSIKELDLFLNYIKAFIERIDIEISEYQEMVLKNETLLIFQYRKELALRRKQEFTEIYDFVSVIKDKILAAIIEEREAKLREEQRIREEEEARRQEEERRVREAELKAIEEERLREEAELRRIEEEKNRENEILQKYAKLSSKVESELLALSKNKGVLVTVLTDRSNRKIASVLNDSIDEEKLIKFANCAIDIISEHRENDAGASLLYWVLEFGRGLIAVRMIDSEKILLTVAGTGANFGVLRYAIEKTKESIEHIFLANEN